MVEREQDATESDFDELPSFGWILEVPQYKPLVDKQFD
jgi:hypothetical protein